MKFNTRITFSDIKNLIEKNPKVKQHFRYFEHRNHDCFKNHLYHFILNDSEPIGYGHLDHENGKTWLGMCVFDSFVNLGYGKILLQNLINNRKNHILHLTVDKDNYKAINLYLNNKFKIYDQTSKIFYCRLKK